MFLLHCGRDFLGKGEQLQVQFVDPLCPLVFGCNIHHLASKVLHLGNDIFVRPFGLAESTDAASSRMAEFSQLE